MKCRVFAAEVDVGWRPASCGRSFPFTLAGDYSRSHTARWIMPRRIPGVYFTIDRETETMRGLRFLSTAAGWVLMCWAAVACADRPRLIVTTDIGGDPDDSQSMVRLLVHANEFDIELLVASASGTPGELKKNIVRPDLIRERVEAYARVYPMLRKHDPGFPDPAMLLKRIAAGNPNRGVQNLGEGCDTEASRRIIEIVDRDDPRPVNIAIWGGSTDLAQALWRVRHDRSAEELAAFLAKIRVHDIAHQDTTGEWINREFPSLFYILSRAPKGRDKREAVFRGMYLGGDMELTSLAWIDRHVRNDHGPLGALYPPKTWTAPNPHGALKEGDTPSWFYFLPVGLSDPEHPDWGCWGGRFRPSETNPRLWIDAQDRVGETTSARATVWRWRPDFQNEFQARMDWCVQPPEACNHPPRAILEGDDGTAVLQRRVHAGEKVHLSAVGSRDPDGDRLEYRWWIYPEPSRYPKAAAVSIAQHDTEAEIDVPADAAGTTLHVVLEVRDDGRPPLVRYRRMILNITD
ncbi:MAG: DUF1593 domain-containing protein [Planctomycetota bacterium]|nr:MAG: DUF1593 domain-containing protein [Planctomycetota bacterium]